jgi:hypothetical protein
MHASYPMPSYNIKYLYRFTLYISLYAIMMCHTMHDAWKRSMILPSTRCGVVANGLVEKVEKEGH